MRFDPALKDDAKVAPRHTRGPWKRVVRSVLDLAGPHARLVRHAETPWASVTFSGARHTIVLGFEGAEASDAADLFIAALPEHEFAISGRLVADASIRAVDQHMLPSPRVQIEAELLVLDDA